MSIDISKVMDELKDKNAKIAELEASLDSMYELLKEKNDLLGDFHQLAKSCADELDQLLVDWQKRTTEKKQLIIISTIDKLRGEH